MGERERTNLLFLFLALIGLIYWRRDEQRKDYVDRELGSLKDSVLGSRERAAARSALWRGAIGLAAVLVVVLQILQAAGTL